MNPEKKKRTRRSAEKMAELVLEAERTGASVVCRRENIAPAQLSRWRQKFLQSGIAGLKDIKRGPRQKESPEIAEIRAESERRIRHSKPTLDLFQKYPTHFLG